MKGKNAGEKHERCRAITDKEMATEEMRAGGWYNAVATPVIQVAAPPSTCCIAPVYLRKVCGPEMSSEPPSGIDCMHEVLTSAGRHTGTVTLKK